MNFETEIISSKGYIYNKILGKAFLVLLALLLVLVVDREFEGGLLSLVDAPKSVYVIIWFFIAVTFLLSIHASLFKYKLGNVKINNNEILSELRKGKPEIYPFNKIDEVAFILNRKEDKAKYARSILVGGKNWIKFNYKGELYKFEFLLNSIKKDEELDIFLEYLKTTFDKKIKIIQ